MACVAGYHFDGLATIMALRFEAGQLHLTVSPFHSELFDHWQRCVFFGSGTGPTKGEYKVQRTVRYDTVRCGAVRYGTTRLRYACNS